MNFPNRKPTRIPGYDYTRDNYYFITICTHEKRCLFGKAGERNIFGQIAQEELFSIGTHYESVYVDKAVIMPNHIHAIIVIGCDNTNAVRPNLNAIVGQYKAGVTRKIRKKDPGAIIWQRSYHDHVIRDQTGYERIWRYIDTNVQKWEDDCFFVR